MKSYINYVKRQNKHVQDIHALLFGGVITIALTSIWLQYEYGVFYPQYKRLPDNVSTMQDSNSTSTNDSYYTNSNSNIKNSTSTKVENLNDLWSSFNQILNNTKKIVH